MRIGGWEIGDRTAGYRHPGTHALRPRGAGRPGAHTPTAAGDPMPEALPGRDFVASGRLMSYSPTRSSPRKPAICRDGIARGTGAADHSVEEPAGFESVATVKTTKGLRLIGPPSVLVRTGEVIR